MFRHSAANSVLVPAVCLCWCVRACQGDKYSNLTDMAASRWRINTDEIRASGMLSSQPPHPAPQAPTSPSLFLLRQRSKPCQQQKNNHPLLPYRLMTVSSSSHPPPPPIIIPSFPPSAHCLTVCCCSCRQPGYDHNTPGRRHGRRDAGTAKEWRESKKHSN